MSGPLSSYRVLDFTWVYAGPMMTQLLADMSAQVIKVESRSRMDGTRLGRPIVGDHIAAGDEGKLPELQPLFHGLNRNKLDITIDLQSPAGISAVHKLVAECDVVAENWNAGVADRLGLGYSTLSSLNPRLVMVSMSGAGQTGPLRDLTTYASTIAALSGLASVVGYPDEAPLGAVIQAYGDANAALHAAFAIFTALYRREQTGYGEYIDMSQWEAGTVPMAEALMDYLMNGRIAKPVGNDHSWMAPHNIYPCRGDDKWISIAVGCEAQWRALCRVLGDPDWATEERFADAYYRVKNRRELDDSLSRWTRAFNPVELADQLTAAGVPAAPVMNIADQFEDLHFSARELHVGVEHPVVGYEILQGIPWKLSATPGLIERPAPLLGQHNDYVFRELLGLNDAQIAVLNEECVPDA